MQSTSMRLPPGVRTGAGLGIALATFFFLVRYFFPFFSDDALISLRYAQRLNAGLGLTWDDYERVEGYTDLLWILLCALPMKLGASGIWTARLLGTLGTLTAVVAVGLGPIRLRFDWARVWFGSLFLGTLVPLAVWAVGGLEHGFMTGVLVVGFLLLDRARHRARGRRRALLVAAAPFAALTLLRADGALFVAAASLGLLLSSRPSKRVAVDLVLFVAPSLLVWLAQLGFRYAYYGDVVPNTARVKVALTTARLSVGLQHVSAGVTPLLASFVLFVALVVLARGRRFYRAVPALMATVLWCAYVLFVGGDIFPGWRQLLLGFVPFGFALATVGRGASLRFSRSARLPVSAALVILFGAQLVLQRRDSENERAKTERWEWEGLSIGPALKRAFEERAPLMAVDAAGALPYWTGFPSLDMLGLSDRFLATHPPAWHGKDGAIGHDLGDADYFLRRRPDFFAFCNAAGAESPCFRASRQLVRRREFREEYRGLRFLGGGRRRAVGVLHVRVDGKLGRESSDSRTSYPGYFLAAVPVGALAVLEEGRFVARVSRGEPGMLERVALSPGRYLVSAETTAPLLFSLRCGRRTVAAATRRMIVEFDASRTSDLLVAPESGAASVRSVTFERVEEEATHRCASVGSPVPSGPLTSFEEGSSWLAPPAVLFDERGVRLSFDSSKLGSEVRVLADNNDRLRLDVRASGELVTTLSVEVLWAPGMRLRRIPVPDEFRGRTFDEIVVVPETGDGSYSVAGIAVE